MIKYIAALLLFGSNGIVTSHISLNSYEIVISESHGGFGIFCALMSALLYASMVSFNKKAEGIVGLENATLQLSIAFLTVFIFVLLKRGVYIQIPSSDILPLIFLGLINTGLGCFLYFSSIADIQVQTVAILGYLEPLSAVLFSFIFLHEHMSPMQLIGAVFIIAGAVLNAVFPAGDKPG